MIKRNKIICKAIAAAISLCVFNTYLTNIPVSAANQSTQNERQAEDSGTLKVDGMVIKNGVLISGEDAEGDIEIPSNVTKIAEDAFWNNEKITSVKIPSSVTEIGEDAFVQCENITKVNIPGSVKVISRSAFCNNHSLTEVTIEDGVETIAEEAFGFDDNLKEINIPDSVKLIKSRAFYQCNKLKDINYSKDTELEISAFAFTEYQPHDDDFFVVDGVLKDIGVNTYGDVVIPDGVKEIGKNAFVDKGKINKVIIPEGVKKIDGQAFWNCQDLTEVTLPESLETIDTSAFYGCYNLSKINIPSKLKTIGSYAFKGCSSLGDITIPDSTTSIGDYAFFECSNLANVNMNTQGKTIGTNSFPIGVKINGNSISQNNNVIPSNSVKGLNPAWNYIEGYWYYADASGNMYRNQWYFNGYNWYYLSKDGKMYTGGPIEIDGVKYIFDYINGDMLTGWQYDHLMRAWNYFNPDSDGSQGAMVKSKWVYTGGKWYYLKDNGNMARNTTIDGYYVDDTGAWVR